MWRKTSPRASIAAVLAGAICFCLLFAGFTLGSRADDTVPTLYVNDEVWYKTGLYPLRVFNSICVPISIFEQIKGVTVTFYDNNTAMIYRSETSFISFDFNRDQAMSQNNERFWLRTYVENNERYVPLITICKQLDLEYEVYRSEIDGSTSVRICDGMQTKTFLELLERHNPGALNVVTTPPTTETTTMLDPVENAVFLSIDGLGDGKRILSLLALFEEFGVVATFFITPEELEAQPSAVLSILAAGHTIGFLVEAEGTLETLDEANRALMDCFKITTRLIRIAGEPLSTTDEEAVMLAGYFRWGSHIDLGTTENEVRAALVTFRRSLGAEGHIVLRAHADGFNVVGYLREFFQSANGRRVFSPITPAYPPIAE